MRKALLFLVIAVFLGLVITTSACWKPAEPVTTTMIVEGMHCQGCSDAITAALTNLEGVTTVTADHESGVTTAVHDPTAGSSEALKTTIEGLGYTVTSTSSD